MMKNSKIILSCLISIIFTTSASAAWVPLTGEPNSLSSLPRGVFIFGDKKLSEMELFGSGTGGAIAPNTDSVFVQGGWDDATGNYGLRFLLSGSGNAGSGQTVNVNLSFKISILPAYENYSIDDVDLILSGASATGNGVVSVAETVWDAFPGSGGDVIASLSCSKQYGDKGAYLVDSGSFTPLEQIYIRSKDISLSGGTNGTAHISEFFQFYSQVPEPATLVLLGTAGIWIFTRKKQQFLGGHRNK